MTMHDPYTATQNIRFNTKRRQVKNIVNKIESLRADEVCFENSNFQYVMNMNWNLHWTWAKTLETFTLCTPINSPLCFWDCSLTLFSPFLISRKFAYETCIMIEQFLIANCNLNISCNVIWNWSAVGFSIALAQYSKVFSRLFMLRLLPMNVKNIPHTKCYT